MKVKRTVIDLLLAFFALAQVFVHLYNVEGDAMNGVRVFPGLLCLLYYLAYGSKRIRHLGVVVAVFLSMTMAISMLCNGNTRPANFLWIWSYMGVAMMLYEFAMRVFWARILFYVCSMFFVFLAFQGNVDAHEVMYGTSENGISAACILVLFIYYVSIIKSGGTSIPYVPILIILIISLWTATRSSMIVMGILLAYAAYYNNFRKGKKSFWGQLIALGIVAFGAVYFFQNYYELISVGFESKIGREGFVNQDRTTIWGEYFSSIFDSPGNFLFGTSGNDPSYPIFHHFHGNAHNAFIILHSKYGLMGFLFVVICLMKAFRKAIRQKEYYLLILLIVAFIRSMFDWVAFPGNFDAIFYFYILYGIDKHGLIKVQDAKETNIFI